MSKVLALDEYAAKETRKAKRRTGRRSRQQLERQAQIRVVDWARDRVLPGGDRLRLWWTPNEAAGGKKAGAQRKALGVLAGVPDLIVSNPIPTHPEARGLGIELKAPGGTLSAAQKNMHRELRRDGWIVKVFFSAQDAIDYLTTVGF